MPAGCLIRAQVTKMNAAAALKPSAKRRSDACPGVVDSESDRAAWAPRSQNRASRIFGTKIPISNYYGPAAGLHDFGQGAAYFFVAAARAARRGANGMAPPAAAWRAGAAASALALGGATGLALSAELIFTRSLVAR